ncbi:MAG TPA: hypothetical protein PL001_00025 [Candidatus Kryptobacter bacterium]|nr:hypothetical protein [Candidatus Kryptobacter bacterium]
MPLAQPSVDSLVQQYLPGQASETQQEFFSRQTLGGSTIVGAVTYFGNAGGEFSNTTNFEVAGLVPANYDGYLATGIQFSFDTLQSIGDITAALQDMYYIIKVAGYDYKRGQGLELLDYVYIAQDSTAEIGTSGVALTDPHILAGSQGAYLTLRQPIPMSPLASVRVTLNFVTDVANLHSASTCFSFIGYLTRKIAG